MLNKEELKINDCVVVFQRGVEDLQTKEYRIRSIKDGRIVLDNGLEFVQDTLLDANVGTRMLFLGSRHEYIHYVKLQRELIARLGDNINGNVSGMKTSCKKLSSCCTRINALNRTGCILRTLKNTELKRLVKTMDGLEACKDEALSLLLQIEEGINNINAYIGEYVAVSDLIESGKSATGADEGRNMRQIRQELYRICAGLDARTLTAEQVGKINAILAEKPVS